MVGSVDVLTLRSSSSEGIDAETISQDFSFRTLINDSFENVKKLIYDVRKSDNRNSVNAIQHKEVVIQKNLTNSIAKTDIQNLRKRKISKSQKADQVEQSEVEHETKRQLQSENAKPRSEKLDWSKERIEDILPQYDEDDCNPKDDDKNKLWGIFPIPPWQWLNDHEFSVPAKLYPNRRRQSSGSKRNRVHLHADSLFSSTSGFTDYSGFFNLCMILLVLANLRVALENIIKYGILIQPLSWLQVLIKEPYSWPSFVLFLCCNTFILVTFWIERALAKVCIHIRLSYMIMVNCKSVFIC